MQINNLSTAVLERRTWDSLEGEAFNGRDLRRPARRRPRATTPRHAPSRWRGPAPAAPREPRPGARRLGSTPPAPGPGGHGRRGPGAAPGGAHAPAGPVGGGAD